MTDQQPKLLPFAKAAPVIGEDVETLKAWADRELDPLPTVDGKTRGSGQRRHRKVVMAEVDAWLARQASKGAMA
jgi:hypothetical protein